jgi:uncharacterized protein
MSIQSMRWEWDIAKAAANERTHGVTFAEAATVLDDERAITREDTDSVGERRFVSLGMSAANCLSSCMRGVVLRRSG